MSIWSTLRNLPNGFLASLRPGSPGRNFLLEEKILATLRVYGNRVRFLPSVDQIVEETTDMRIAYRQMLREPAVKAPLLQKVLAVAQEEAQVNAASESPVDQIAADFVRHCIKRSRGGVRRMALSVLFGGLMDGYSASEKTWRVENRGYWAGKIILKQLKSKDTRYAHLEGDQYRNVLYVRDTRNNLRYTADNFVIWSHLPIFENPTGWSDFRSAYRAFWLMDTAQKLRAVGLERFSLPAIKGEYEDPEQRPTLEAAIQNLRSLGWISLPKGAQIEAMDLATKSQPEFTIAIQDLRQEMFLAIAGAVLQGLQGTTTDGRGDSSVHKDTAELLTWYLAAELGDALSDQLVPDLIDMNFAEADYPRITLGSISDSSLAASLNVDKGLQEMGLPLSKAEMYAKYARQKPTDTEDELQPPQPAASSTGYSFPPSGGDFSEDDLLTVVPGPDYWVPQKGGPGSDQPLWPNSIGIAVLPDGSDYNPVWDWGSNYDATGYDSAPDPTPVPLRETNDAELQGRSDLLREQGVRGFDDGDDLGSPGLRPRAGFAVFGGPGSGPHKNGVGNLAGEFASKVKDAGMRAIKAGGAHIANAAKQGAALASQKIADVRRGLPYHLAVAASKPVEHYLFAHAIAQHQPFPLATSVARAAAYGAAYAAHAIGQHAAKHAETLTVPMPQVNEAALREVSARAARAIGGIKAALDAQTPALTDQEIRAMVLAALNGSTNDPPAAGDVPQLGTPPGADSERPPVRQTPAAATGNKFDDKGGPAASGASFPVAVKTEVAPTGGHKDQQKADQLLSSAIRQGVAVLSDISRSAYSRLLAQNAPMKAKRLFDDDETARLADSLASISGTANLLGRSRIQIRADKATSAPGVNSFADDPTDLTRFDEQGLAPMQPVEAAEYFNSLVPTLGIDAKQFDPLMQRHAFTMAEATEETMLQRAKEIIADVLQNGRSPNAASWDIQELLNKAGVTSQNPQYAEMVVRTNLLDAYNVGSHEQLQENADTFPVWRYSGIRDGRQGKDHEPHFDKYYPSNMSFAEVRGDRPFNCRCTFVPIDKWTWGKLQNGGAEVAKFSESATPFLAVPNVPQQDGYGCGAAAAMSVGRFFGFGPADFAAWEKALGTNAITGTPPEAIVRVLSGLGLHVQARQFMTLGDLRECWQCGQPVICPIQEYGDGTGPGSYDNGHYVVVIGLTPGYVAVQDPMADVVLDGADSDAAPGRVLIEERKFLEAWHDCSTDGRYYLRFGIAAGR